MDLSNTLEYINLTGLDIGLVALRGRMHLCACVSEERGDGEGTHTIFSRFRQGCVLFSVE